MKKRLPLRKFRLQNFKAVRDSGTIVFGPLTVFIGNNGSGKSSLVEGLETFWEIALHDLDPAMARWRGFEYVWNQAVGHELRRPSRGRAYYSPPMSFQIELTVGTGTMKAGQAVALGEKGRKLFIQKEEIVLSSPREVSRWTRNAHGKVKGPKARSAAGKGTGYKLADGQSAFRDFLGWFIDRWQFLSLVPDAMGQPTPQQRAAGRIRLAKNGANVAEYLNEIRELDAGAFRGIVEALQAVLPFAQDLQPRLASELQREFFLNLTEASFEVPGWLLSTGTLRILALLACLRHPEPPPLLVVEEVENGLDPRTLHLLVEEIRAALETGKTQVILTTHSPYLLDLLDLSHIIVVERVDGQPTFTRPDKAALADWAKSFSPGHLYTMGRLTREEP